MIKVYLCSDMRRHNEQVKSNEIQDPGVHEHIADTNTLGHIMQTRRGQCLDLCYCTVHMSYLFILQKTTISINKRIR